MAHWRLGNFLKDHASTVFYNMIYNILEVLKACRLYVLIESTFRSKIKAEDQLAHPRELTWNSKKTMRFVDDFPLYTEK